MLGFIGDALGAAASAVSGIFTNKTNKKIARESNQLQEQMFNQQQGFSEEQFARQVFENNRNFAEDARRYEYQKKTDRERYKSDWERQKWMVNNSAGNTLKDLFEAADESGIHRLAALGSAGASSYQPAGGFSSSSPSGQSPGVGGPNIPALQSAHMSDPIGRAITQFSEARHLRHSRDIDKQQQKRLDALARKEQQLIDGRIELMEAQAHTQRVQAHRTLTGGPQGSMSDITTPVQKLETPFGTFRPHPKHAPAAAWQHQYGDVVESLAGIFLLGYDAANNFSQQFGATPQQFVQDVNSGKVNPSQLKKAVERYNRENSFWGGYGETSQQKWDRMQKWRDSSNFVEPAAHQTIDSYEPQHKSWISIAP